jgi:tRNA threonylcarbamoyladenosine biosynthesis protein TsaE
MRNEKSLRSWTTQTSSPEATQSLAERLGKLLQPGDVVALIGELGSGKTVFSQGLACGLGVPKTFYITSPTFAIINEYPGRVPFYHLDLYRVSGPGDLSELGLEEILYGQGAVAIEWAERLDKELPAERLEVHLTFLNEMGRNIAFSAFGDKLEKRLATLVSFYKSANEKS